MALETITGHGLHVHSLRDQERLNDALADNDLEALFAQYPPDECVGVYGEDLGVAIAAIVHLPSSTTIWSDADGKGTVIPDGPGFAQALSTVLNAVISYED